MSPVEHSPQVFRAAGMLAMQTDCLVEEALALMHECAEVADVSVDAIAIAVLDGSIHLGTGSSSAEDRPA